MASSNIFQSQAYYINSLMLGYSWTGITGSAANVTYSYHVATTPGDDASGLVNGGVMSTIQQNITEQALQAWENVANIHFNETSSASIADSSIIIRQADMPSGIAGWMDPALSSNTQFSFADLVFDRAYNSNPTVGSYQYSVFLHEIGHAMGLKHPGDYSELGAEGGPYLPASEDSNNLSVMSYYHGSAESVSGFPVTPMLYDIAAVQFLYGANTSYNAGNTVYSLTGAKTNMTLWDGGGNDTLDSTAYFLSGVVLDLRAGKDNITRVGSSSNWIAFNANIENAISGTGDDDLYGNALDNVLTAGAGIDIAYGFEGADSLFGNYNNDILYGGSGGDNIYGGKDNDTLYGGSGSADVNDSADIIYGGEGSDIIYGNAGDDILYGGVWVADAADLADSFYGGLGNDIIYGNGGDDIIFGNSGNDTMYGGLGSDIFFLFSGDGADVIYGFIVGDDKIAVADSLYSSAVVVLSHIFYTEVGAVIDFGNNNNVNVTGLVPGSLTTDSFITF